MAADPPTRQVAALAARRGTQSLFPFPFPLRRSHLRLFWDNMFLQTTAYIWNLVRVCYDWVLRRVRPDDVGVGAEGPNAGLPAKKASGSMNRRDLVLAILAAADGRTYTPVQIQKAAFVICDQFPDLIDQGPGFHFEPYDYGPFDSDVYFELSRLHDAGDAEIAPSAYGNWNTYAASDAGIDRGWDLLSQLSRDRQRYVKEVSSWVRSLSFKKLVKSIYEAYPAMRANSIFRG
jgi:hypothetical protein